MLGGKNAGKDLTEAIRLLSYPTQNDAKRQAMSPEKQRAAKEKDDRPPDFDNGGEPYLLD